MLRIEFSKREELLVGIKEFEVSKAEQGKYRRDIGYGGYEGEGEKIEVKP